MPEFDATSLAAIFIAVVTAVGSWASHRASSKATAKASEGGHRVEMEKEAYDRARKLDVDTIKFQDEELKELREQNAELKNQNRELRHCMRQNDELVAKNDALIAENARLRAEVSLLAKRVDRLESGHTSDDANARLDSLEDDRDDRDKDALQND